MLSKPAQSALVTAQDHIKQALDPKALDVYPLDAIRQAQDVLLAVKRKPQALKDALATIKQAQDLIEQDALDLAFDHITQAQANIEQTLTTGNQKGVKAA